MSCHPGHNHSSIHPLPKKEEENATPLCYTEEKQSCKPKCIYFPGKMAVLAQGILRFIHRSCFFMAYPMLNTIAAALLAPCMKETNCSGPSLPVPYLQDGKFSKYI